MKRIYLAQRGQGLKRACHGKQLQLVTALKKRLFEWRSLPCPLKKSHPSDCFERLLFHIFIVFVVLHYYWSTEPKYTGICAL